MAHEVVVADEGRVDRDASWVARCSCGWASDMLTEEAADFAGFRHKTQGFFAELAAEMRKPHFGDAFRDYQKALLTRAQEAHLFNPEAS